MTGGTMPDWQPSDDDQRIVIDPDYQLRRASDGEYFLCTPEQLREIEARPR